MNENDLLTRMYDLLMSVSGDVSALNATMVRAETQLRTQGQQLIELAQRVAVIDAKMSEQASSLGRLHRRHSTLSEATQQHKGWKERMGGAMWMLGLVITFGLSAASFIMNMLKH